MIAKLRKRVALEEPIVTKGAGGEREVVWRKRADLWAEIRETSGEEAYENGKISVTRRQRILIRHRGDITENMRFRMGSRHFHIRAVLDRDGRGEFLTCVCEEDPSES